MTQPQVLPALDLIVFDAGNPHSVAFQLQILIRYLDNLTRLLGGPREGRCGRRWRACRPSTSDASKGKASPTAAPAIPASRWRTILGEVSRSPRAALSDRLAMRYFSHVSDVSRLHPRLLIAVNPPAARYHVFTKRSTATRSPVSLSRQLAASDPARLLLAALPGAPDQRRAPEGERHARAPSIASAIRCASWRSNFPHSSLAVRAESTIEVLPHLPPVRWHCPPRPRMAAGRSRLRPGR
jgi:hypothetical protein